jgi:uncharacterized repeat protein (TIGR01451 family)
MSRKPKRICPVLLAAGLLGLLSGCFGVSQNPSYFPHLLPTGDIIRTHAKPPGFGYWSNFDPHACRLEVRPLEATNPVQTQHVLIATIYDEKGCPRRNRRVEWMIEGVGNIVEVDESGFFPGRGYKVDNKYAVSYTDYCEHKIDRGNNNPNDDFVIRPGQTWCVISSAVEGDTHVTVYAPEINNWDCHKVFVTKHWVDAEWTLPLPAVNRAGTQHTFTVNIFKHTDHKPLENYRVRYRILGGPPAVFLPHQSQEFTAVSDLSGNASATLAQVTPQPGVNRIGIEIIRAPEPCSPSGSGIVIGRGETTKEWLAPSLALVKTAPPAAAVGQEIPYTITVTNNGRVESQAMTVRDPIPEGLQYVRSEPPATIDNDQLTWTFSALPPGQAHTAQVVFRATRTGPVTNCANVTGADGLKADNCVTTQVTAPQLRVTKTGPLTGVVGMPVTYQIAVTNPGTGPATNVLLRDQFDAGLEHESRANPVELPVGTLAPGETKTVTLNLIPRTVGALTNRVSALADGNLTARAEHTVTVQRAQLAIKKTGPAARYVDRPAVWDIRVTNPGETALANVVVRDQLPPELGFQSATQGGQQTSDGQVLWNLGTLGPREEKLVQLTTRCLKIAPRALNVAIATADPGLQVQDEAAVEIRGLPAFRLEVVDVDDPIEVGGKTAYKIDVTNQGSLPGNQVEIRALVPRQMKVINANGPSQPRVEGQQVLFPPVDSLQPGQTLNYSVEVQALEPGDVRFRVELRSATLSSPVIEEESTTVVAPAAGTAPPIAPPAAPRGGAAPGAGGVPPGPMPPPPGPVTPPPAGPAPVPPAGPAPVPPAGSGAGVPGGAPTRTPVATSGPATSPPAPKPQ